MSQNTRRALTKKRQYATLNTLLLEVSFKSVLTLPAWDIFLLFLMPHTHKGAIDFRIAFKPYNTPEAVIYPRYMGAKCTLANPYGGLCDS